MGGSSLAPEVFRRSWADQRMTLHVLDSTHPDVIRATVDAIDLERTLFVVSSKSGGTIETMSQFKYFHELQSDGAHYVAVTDPARRSPSSAASTASGACSRTTPRSAAATRRCRTSGSCRRR